VVAAVHQGAWKSPRCFTRLLLPLLPPQLWGRCTACRLMRAPRRKSDTKRRGRRRPTRAGRKRPRWMGITGRARTCGFATWVAVAVIEAPGATFIRRQGPGKRDAHAMIARGKIDLAFAVAIAEFQQPAHTVDAQPFDHVARPAAAVGLAGQAPLGREHAIAAHRRNVTLEVGLVAEQKSVLELPLDVRCGAGRGLRVDRLSAPGREHKEEADDKERAHGICRDRLRPMIGMADAAEM
jgi:hypothetical protein